jgi:hypothetical protein
VLRRPINPPSKSPSRPSVNTVVPNSILNPRSSTGSTGTTGTTGGTQNQDLSSLSGSSLDNSIISGIKSSFSGIDDRTSDISPVINSLLDLYTKYPQINKTKFLDLYDRAINGISGYSGDFLSKVRSGVNSQIA